MCDWDHIGNDPTNKKGGEVITRGYYGQPFDFFLLRPIGFTSLAAAAVVDEYTVTVDDPTGIVAGSYLGIFDIDRFNFSTVLGVVGSVITLDSPLDFAFPIGADVLNSTRDMNVDASGGSIVFQIGGPGLDSDQALDVTRLIVQITCDNAPAFSAFGDISGGLVNGLVLRISNGITINVGNIKTNQEFANVAYDYTVYEATNPGIGVWGIAIRYTLAGQEKHGAAIRLYPADSLQVIIQDDLSDLVSFRTVVQGHIVNL